MDVLAAGNHLNKFFEGNNGYVEIKSAKESANSEVNEIDEFDDEVWILQAPKGTDLTKLEAQKIKLPGRTHFNDLEAVAIEFESPKKQSIGYSNSKGKYAIRLLPINGSVLLRKRLKANHIPEEIESSHQSKGRVPFPNCIKVRHPLLGAQFEEKIELSDPVLQSLRNAQNKCNTITRKRQKSKHLSKFRTSIVSNKYSHFENQLDTVVKKAYKKKYVATDGTEHGEDTPRKREKKLNTIKPTALKHEDLSDELNWLNAL